MRHSLHRKDWRNTRTVFISRCSRSAVKSVGKGCLQVNDTQITWTCTRTSKPTSVQIVLSVSCSNRMSPDIFAMVYAQNAHLPEHWGVQNMYVISHYDLYSCNTFWFSGIFVSLVGIPNALFWSTASYKMYWILMKWPFWDSWILFTMCLMVICGWWSKNDGKSRSRVSPGSRWNYPGLSTPHINQLPTVHESLFYVHHQSKRYFMESSDPPGMLSDEGISHQGSTNLGVSASAKRPPSKHRYTCPICDKGFTLKWFFTDHVNAHNKIKAHSCPKCSKRFTFTSDVGRHLRNGVCTKYTPSTWIAERVQHAYMIS